MKHFLTVLATCGLALAGTACESSIQPIRAIERVEVWVPDEPTPSTTSAPASEPSTTAQAVADTTPATAPTTSIAAATAPATQPGHMVVTVVDPNETSRFIYKASYDTIWQQGMTVLTKTGFLLDRKDYRLGVLTSQPLPSTQIVEFWKPQFANPKDAMENTINSQRRTIRLRISNVPGKPDFYQIGIQVIVERQNNPTEEIGGPVFVEGSGFGRNRMTLRSDYADPKVEESRWFVLGHDPDLETKLLNELFEHL